MLKADKTSGILYREWKSASPRAVFLLIHGLGAHSERWKPFGDFFSNKNFSSYALEFKGFGETKDLKGHVDAFRIYIDDIYRLRDIIRKENPGKKIFIIGESLGGLIAFLSVAAKPDFFDSLICLSPAFAARIKLKPSEYFGVFLSLATNPKKQFKIPFNSEMCTRDKERCLLMENDPREHRLASARFLAETFIAQKKSPFLARKVKIPVLFLLSGQDFLTDPEKAEKIFKALKSRQKKIIKYADMRHSLSIELGKERVFTDVLKWAEDII